MEQRHDHCGTIESRITPAPTAIDEKTHKHLSATNLVIFSEAQAHPQKGLIVFIACNCIHKELHRGFECLLQSPVSQTNICVFSR